jgi:hypothetical protein
VATYRIGVDSRPTSGPTRQWGGFGGDPPELMGMSTGRILWCAVAGILVLARRWMDSGAQADLQRRAPSR